MQTKITQRNDVVLIEANENDLPFVSSLSMIPVIELDEVIIMLTCIRNAKHLGFSDIKEEDLYKSELGGEAFAVGILAGENFFIPLYVTPWIYVDVPNEYDEPHINNYKDDIRIGAMYGKGEVEKFPAPTTKEE